MNPGSEEASQMQQDKIPIIAGQGIVTEDVIKPEIHSNKIPVELPILTRNQRKNLKKKEKNKKKNQAGDESQPLKVAQTGDESQPLSSDAQILLAQVATFKEIAFEIIKGLKTEEDIQMFETFMQKMKKITDQAFERKRATLADK